MSHKKGGMLHTVCMMLLRNNNLLENTKWNKSLLNSYLILLQAFMSCIRSFTFMPKVWDIKMLHRSYSKREHRSWFRRNGKLPCSLYPYRSHKILELAEKLKWDEAIIDGSSKVQNYLLNAIMVIEKKNSLRKNSKF